MMEAFEVGLTSLFFSQVMGIVTVVNAFATMAGQVNTVTVPQIPRLVFLMMASSAVGEANVCVENVYAQILGFQATSVKNTLHMMILAAPNGKLFL